MIVWMIWWLHVVELVFLMIFICHMSDLEFNNMFKIEFNLRILKLGFITRMNVFNWNLGHFDSGIISCWFIVGCVPYEICNRLVYSSLTEDVWIVGSCLFKFSMFRRKPVIFLANFRPSLGLLICFDCMNRFLVVCRCYLELVVGWGCRERILRPSPKFFRRPLSKLQFSTCSFKNDEVWSLRFPELANFGFLF